MGLPPGPPRDPNSRRGRREARWAAQAAEQGVTQPVPELRMPDGDKSVDEVWQDICDQLTAAHVPLQQVDAYSIELCARALVNMRKSERLTEAEEEKVASTSPSPATPSQRSTVPTSLRSFASATVRTESGRETCFKILR